MLRQTPSDIAGLANINSLMVGKEIAGGYGRLCEVDVFDHCHREGRYRNAARFVENFSDASDAAAGAMPEACAGGVDGLGVVKERHDGSRDAGRMECHFR